MQITRKGSASVVLLLEFQPTDVSAGSKARANPKNACISTIDLTSNAAFQNKPENSFSTFRHMMVSR